jgi:DNA polymerase III alpha subunit
MSFAQRLLQNAKQTSEKHAENEAKLDELKKPKSLKLPRSLPPVPVKSDGDDFTESFSKLRIKNRLISDQIVHEYMHDRLFVPLMKLPEYFDEYKVDIPGDWIIIGVVYERRVKKTKKDEEYLLVRLSDLKDSKVILFFFKSAFKQLKDIPLGSVLLVMNPSYVKPLHVRFSKIFEFRDGNKSWHSILILLIR